MTKSNYSENGLICPYAQPWTQAKDGVFVKEFPPMKLVVERVFRSHKSGIDFLVVFDADNGENSERYVIRAGAFVHFKLNNPDSLAVIWIDKNKPEAGFCVNTEVTLSYGPEGLKEEA